MWQTNIIFTRNSTTDRVQVGREPLQSNPASHYESASITSRHSSFTGVFSSNVLPEKVSEKLLVFTAKSPHCKTWRGTGVIMEENVSF